MNARTLLPIALLITALAVTSGAATSGIPCYTISNFAVPNFVNATFNNTLYTIRLNFIGPNSAGITINDQSSYNLTFGQSTVVSANANYTYTSELMNVSWLPVEHTVVIDFCSVPKTPAVASNAIVPVATIPTTVSTSSTSSSSTSTIRSTIVQSIPVITSSNTTSTISQQHTSQPSGSLLQGFINWLEHLI